MSREFGGLESVQGLAPEWVEPIAAVATQLGDVWFLLLVVAAVSWTIERDRGPWPFAVVLGGLALALALKSGFALPRPGPITDPPPETLTSVRDLERVATSEYGFPSGHALGTTVTYGLLATILDRGTRRARFAAVGVLVLVVGVTRLILGVHYPIDVVAGVLIGVGYLAAALRVLERSPVDRTTTAFAIALATSGLAVAAGGGTSAASYLAMAAVGIAIWSARAPTIEPRPARRIRSGVVATAAALVFAVGAFASYPVLVALAAVASGAVLLPWLPFRSRSTNGRPS